MYYYLLSVRIHVLGKSFVVSLFYSNNATQETISSVQLLCSLF